ncbi:MAG: TonB-dependent receptor [Bacteroidetes bacterium]|jgi:iron complex outermembrane receptor protein|nr:TonB-dependent receptor [Bacteroidota bacterium]
MKNRIRFYTYTGAGKTACLTIFILISLSFSIFGQMGVWKGKVLFDGKAAPFASIYIPSQQKGLTTDSAGYFLIQDIAADTLVVQVTYVGAIPKADTLIAAPGRDNFVIRLEAQADILEQVVVIDQQTGIQSPTPFLITRVSSRELEYSGSAGGIMGVLQQDPSISAAELGPGIVKPFIRGLGFSRVVTLFQGNKLENHQWGADHGLGINELGIGRVDIIKGPASLLYGSGAIGGVLLLQDDERLRRTKRWRGEAGLTLHSNSLGVRPTFRLGRSFSSGFFIEIDAALSSHADYLAAKGRPIGNSRFSNRTLRFHSGFLGDRGSHRLSYTYNHQKLGIIEDNELEQSLATSRNDRDQLLPHQKVADHILSYNFKWVNNDWVSNIHLSHHLNTRREIENSFDEVDLGLIQHHSFYTARVSHSGARGWQHTLGLQGSRVDNRNMPEALEILIPDALHWENGLFYLGAFEWNNYYLQGGLRYDYRQVTADASAPHLVDYGFILPGNPGDRKLTTSFDGWTGSLGMTRFDSYGGSLRLNLSTGYRAPDLAELFSNGPHPGTNRFEVGNANFEREQSFQIDLNYSIAGDRWKGQISGYSNWIERFTFFKSTGEVRSEDGLTIWAFEQAPALLYGLEVEGSYTFLKRNNLRIDFSAAVFRGERRDRTENLTFIPQDNLRVGVSYSPNCLDKLNFSTYWSYFARQTRPGFEEEATDPYSLLESHIKYKWSWANQTLSLGLSGFNLLNARYVPHMSLLRAFEIPNPGRNIVLNMRYGF